MTESAVSIQTAQAIVDAFSTMQEDLNKEKRAITKQWATAPTGRRLEEPFDPADLCLIEMRFPVAQSLGKRASPRHWTKGKQQMSQVKG